MGNGTRADNLVILIIVLMAIPLGGCGDEDTGGGVVSGVTTDEIVLGTSSALSGHAGFLGTQFLKGHQAHFADLNASGGIGGRQIRVVARDDQYDPPQTVLNTMKLIEDDEVFMLFGYVGTPTSVKVIEPIHEAGIPALGFFTGAEALRTPFRPMIFHLRASYYAEAEAAVDYFVDVLGLGRIAVVYQDDAFGHAVLRGVQLALQRRGLGLVATAPITRGSMEVEAAVAPVKNGRSQAVIMVGTYSPLARFIRVCHNREFYPWFDTVSFVGSEAFATELVQANGIDEDQFERIIVTQVVPSPHTEGIEVIREFRESFSRQNPEESLNYVALEGYLNARILAHVLGSTGSSLSRESLVAELENLGNHDFGLGQTISYGPNDRLGLDRVFLSRLTPEGIFRTFEP